MLRCAKITTGGRERLEGFILFYGFSKLGSFDNSAQEFYREIFQMYDTQQELGPHANAETCEVFDSGDRKVKASTDNACPCLSGTSSPSPLHQNPLSSISKNIPVRVHRFSGTMGLYHRSCLEKWLSTSNTAQCEICKFQYVTERRPKPFSSFLLNPGSVAERRSMIGDLVCWCVLTPLAVSSTFLCIQGAVHYSNQGKDQVEVPGLICLAAFLILTYFIWLSVSLRYHYKVWRQWQRKNQVVTIIDLEDKDKKLLLSDSSFDLNNNQGNADPEAQMPTPTLHPSQSLISVIGRPPTHSSTPTNPTSATLTIRFDYTPSGFFDSTAPTPIRETVV